MSNVSIIGAVLGFIISKGSFIGAMIGYFLGSAIGASFFSKSTQKSKSTSFSGYQYGGNSQNDFAKALLVLSASVMKADGVVKKSELEFVKQFSENF